MRISQVYRVMGPLAARGMEMVKERPISSYLVTAIGVKTIKAAFSEEKEDKIEGFGTQTTMFLALAKLEPFLIQGQLYKYPASTLVGVFAGLTFLDGIWVRREAERQEALNLPVFVFSLLLAVGLRQYGPSFTHRYLTWLR